MPLDNRPLLAAIIGLALATAPAVAEPGRVTHVVDGDTVWLEFRDAPVKVRLANLDTPEIGTHAKCEAERRLGEAASAFARQMLPAGKVVDVQPSKRQNDPYGRLLAAIVVDGTDYAEMVIGARLGVAWNGRHPKPVFCP